MCVLGVTLSEARYWQREGGAAERPKVLAGIVGRKLCPKEQREDGVGYARQGIASAWVEGLERAIDAAPRSHRPIAVGEDSRPVYARGPDLRCLRRQNRVEPDLEVADRLVDVHELVQPEQADAERVVVVRLAEDERHAGRDLELRVLEVSGVRGVVVGITDRDARRLVAPRRDLIRKSTSESGVFSRDAATI